MKKALLQLHIAILLWGATAVLGKVISVDETWLVLYRTGITVGTLFILHLFAKNIESVTLQKLLPLLLAGMLLGLHWLCFFASVKYANVAVALICLSCTSFFTMLIEAGLFKQKIKITALLLSLMAILSTTLLFYSDFTLQKGVFYGVAAAVFVAAVPVLQKKHTATFTATTISFYNMLGGFITLCIVVPIYSIYIPQPNRLPSTNDVGYLVLLSWLCTIVTLQLSLRALQHISAFTQNLLLNLEPIYGIALAGLFLQEYEQYNVFFYIGIVLLLVIIGIQTYLIKTKNAT